MSGMFHRAGARLRPVLAFGLLLSAALGLAAAAGCASGPVDYARPYPTHKQAVQTLNIQVFRRADRISFTNTSPHDFGDSTLWINGAYSRPISGIRIGQSMEISLHDFVNEHSQPFRAGGFFATDLPSVLVLAEIESEDQLYGLIVVEDRAEQKR